MIREYSSFRDPSGFVFTRDGSFFRQINRCYQMQYEHLMDSGLYEALYLNKLMIGHKKTNTDTGTPEFFCVIKPDFISFISYPYEWSFNQLKDAALSTLRIHRLALNYGMILKDASAYNIQYSDDKPKLIDTLSFDFYREGAPWVAYGQFCRHFLAPLFLMANVDIRLSQLMRIYIDGIPLDLASKLLAGKGGFDAKQHIRWHAKAIEKHIQNKNRLNEHRTIKISKFNHTALIDNLIKTVENIVLKNIDTTWADYYKNTNYSEEGFKHKSNIVAEFIDIIKPDILWDVGANDGYFTRLALKNGAYSAIAFDMDPIAVDKNYQKTKENKDRILPLLLDLSNPSPGIGFANKERVPVNLRQKPDCIIALALVHHLAISNNLPIEKIVEWFSDLTDNLIIEFIPKEDSQVKKMLADRDDIFDCYNRDYFEKILKIHFDVIRSEAVTQSSRNIYLCKRPKK